MRKRQVDWHFYRLTVMALRHYPTSTKELTLALHLGKGGLATFGMIKVRERCGNGIMTEAKPGT